MNTKKITLYFMAILMVVSFENCKAKSCDTASNVDESKRKMKASGSLFSKKERRRMKH